jgi:hypothetical protein
MGVSALTTGMYAPRLTLDAWTGRHSGREAGRRPMRRAAKLG